MTGFGGRMWPDRWTDLTGLRNDGYSLTLEETILYFNTTRERIRQIEEKALARLRNPMRKKRLQEYVA